MARPWAQVFSDVDGFPQMLLQYVPDGGTGGTAATAAVTTGTDITILIDGEVPAGKDAIGASGVVAFATYTTLGTLRDVLNSTPAYRCILLGGLRADASATKLLTAGAASIMTDSGLRIYGDASATDHISFAITGERFVNNGLDGHVKERGACWNTLLAASLNVGLTGGSPQIIFYFEGQRASDAVQTAFSLVMVDDTLEAIGTDNPSVPYLQAPLGFRIVGRVSVATTVDDIAKFAVLGKSAYMNGEQLIDRPPWVDQN